MSHSIVLTIVVILCLLQAICADPSDSSERRGHGFGGYRRFGHDRGQARGPGPRWGWNWNRRNRAATTNAPFTNTETFPVGPRGASTLAPHLQPNPQHELAKLSTISSTLAPSSPLVQGLNVLRGGGAGANNAPMFNTPRAGLGFGPAADGAAAASNLIPTMAAVAAAATPVRGQSPFPYQPTDFVDPTNNPTGRVPEQPQTSCGPMEFQCQAYQQCYPCYTNTGLPQCMTCLGLMRCTDANCQLKQMCNLCSAASSMAVCPMAQPYCPL